MEWGDAPLGDFTACHQPQTSGLWEYEALGLSGQHGLWEQHGSTRGDQAHS